MYYTEDNLGPRLPCLGSHSHPQDNWFYIMYHGTHQEAAESIMRFGFCPSKDGMLGRGVSCQPRPQKASRYPLNVHPANRLVLVLQVNVGKVVRIDYQEHPLQKTWHGAGYDRGLGAPECGMVASGLEEDCIWDPMRIRVIRAFLPAPTLVQCPVPFQSPLPNPNFFGWH
ncbi:hypothetical protein ANANG_G00320060 [Anguilla anguilla]|uniref:PARP catalytic domain-containing protein n=1 Tax=Anguilla anguilla TaxID=7936 RepID=A0A9D3LHL5_ANGAN|nr:hypothetical protein ANANG_G00320060 [Anguilla anguilla]